jgi:hypothetical protein
MIVRLTNLVWTQWLANDTSPMKTVVLIVATVVAAAASCGAASAQSVGVGSNDDNPTEELPATGTEQ